MLFAPSGYSVVFTCNLPPVTASTRGNAWLSFTLGRTFVIRTRISSPLLTFTCRDFKLRFLSRLRISHNTQRPCYDAITVFDFCGTIGRAWIRTMHTRCSCACLPLSYRPTSIVCLQGLCRILMSLLTIEHSGMMLENTVRSKSKEKFLLRDTTLILLRSVPRVT